MSQIVGGPLFGGIVSYASSPQAAQNVGAWVIGTPFLVAALLNITAACLIQVILRCAVPYDKGVPGDEPVDEHKVDQELGQMGVEAGDESVIVSVKLSEVVVPAELQALEFGVTRHAVPMQN